MVTNTTYALYSYGPGYKNSHGDWITGEPVFIKNIDVDKQPYNRALMLKQYGYDVDVTDRLMYEHFGNDADIGVNSVLKDISTGDEYEVRKIISWDTYMDIFVYSRQ